MMIERTEIWKCSDGETFDIKEEAEIHEANVTLSRYIDDHRIYTTFGVQLGVNGADFLAWLKDNPRILVTLHHE